MARFIVKVAAAAMAAGLLSACGNGGTEPTQGATPTDGATTGTTAGTTAGTTGSAAPEQPGTDISGEVKVRTFPISPEVRANADEDYWAGMITKFNETYPDIKVTSEVLPWADRDTALSSAIAGGVAPDVVYMIPNELVKYEEQDVLEPLDDLLVTDGYFDNALQYTTVNGAQVGAPILMSVVPTVCDQTVLDAIGAEVPVTWDDLLELGEKAKAKGMFATQLGFNPNAAMDMSFLPYVQQAGGSTFNDEGQPTLNSPEVLEALKFLETLAKEGYINVDDSVTAVPTEQSGIAQRKVACDFHNGITVLEPYWGEERAVGAPLTNKESASYGTIGSFTLLKTSENKEAAMAWINWMTEAEQLAALNEFSLFYPPKEGVEVSFADDSPEAKAQEFLDVVTPGVQHPDAREVNGVILPQVQAVLLGQTTPEQAVEEMQSAAEAIVNR